MSFLLLYARVLGFLRAVLPTAVALALANFALAFTQFAEPMVFGKVIDRLTSGLKDWRDIAPLVALWGGFGLFSIVAGVLVSLHADRLVAPPPRRGDGRLFRACDAALAALPRALAFRAVAQGHDRRRERDVRRLAHLLPRCIASASSRLFVMLPLTLFFNGGSAAS